MQADTYILKQDEEHIPDLAKEAKVDALEIPVDAVDNPQQNVQQWPGSKPLPKVGKNFLSSKHLDNISVIVKTDNFLFYISVIVKTENISIIFMFS